MRGDLVILKSYGNEPLARRVWDENDNTVFVTNDEQLNKLLMREDAIAPIGFKREFVFRYDPLIAETMDILYKKGEFDWNKLIRY